MMKWIMTLALLCLMPLAAQAGTPVTKEIAEVYYGNCKAQQDPRMTPESQDALCACTAAKMQESMTVEDIQTMSRNDAAGRVALNHMLVNIYGPCMSFPVQDLVSAQCASDPKIDMMNLKMDRVQLCSCMGKRTGAWFSTKGTSLIAHLLKANPNITDPIGPIMDSADFKRASYDSLLGCMSPR